MREFGYVAENVLHIDFDSIIPDLLHMEGRICEKCFNLASAKFLNLYLAHLCNSKNVFFSSFVGFSLSFRENVHYHNRSTIVPDYIPLRTKLNLP